MKESILKNVLKCIEYTCIFLPSDDSISMDRKVNAKIDFFSLYCLVPVKKEFVFFKGRVQ